MNTITNPVTRHHENDAATAGPILAIDLGKYKSVACVHDAATGEIAFTTFETTRVELQRLIGKEQPAVVIIEACLLAGWLDFKPRIAVMPARSSATPRSAWLHPLSTKALGSNAATRSLPRRPITSPQLFGVELRKDFDAAVFERLQRPSALPLVSLIGCWDSGGIGPPFQDFRVLVH